MSVKAAFQDKCLGHQPVRLNICWYGEPIGSVVTNGEDLRWAGYASPAMEAFFKNVLPTRESDGMPQLVVNLGPDNDVFKVLGLDNQKCYVKTGVRFLSNITISPNAPWDHPVGNDYLVTDFDAHIDAQGVFTGHFMGKLPKSLEEEALTREIAQYWRNRFVPRFSGREIKIPVTLHEQGELQPAISTPFTHLLKFPNEGPKEGWGVNEWMCMQLSAAIGLPTAKHALISLDDSMPPAYLAERFDIDRTTRSGNKRYLLQDFCALAGMRPLDDNHPESGKEGKGAGSMEQIAKLVRKFSSAPDEDIEALYKRCILSWAVNDSDMHRKNISMIFEYDEDRRAVTGARLAPTYDVTAEVHQFDHLHGMALTMAGKRKDFNRKGLIGFARNIGIAPERAGEILDSAVKTMAQEAVRIAQNLPPAAQTNTMCVYTARRIATFAVEKAQTLGLETPEWSPVKRAKEGSAYQIAHGHRRPGIDYMIT